MNAYFSSVLALAKRPSAFVPISMSIAALAMVLVSLAVSGVVRDADEGAVAHLWQILIGGQLPLLAFFLIKWLPRAPQAALSVLALQILAAPAAMAPVYLLGL
ncbi:MAG: hypothetical protein E6K41_14320 [Gammaproteobacteria bacterium]|nr:MAG: hypothetical protein E6K41_14320 [Gammaproteobacteria bacterium]TLZ53841.1 MAG: hypothetical protein E6K22_06845 [Gammaproteobacteria bacterium]TLZ61269.1 MAG: hypothetical protein E6K20_09655 [Gammaproteobacteria bacterium]